MFGKQVIFILGIGRSGTSALTRVLSLCGCTLPSSLVGANEGNPRGHWEAVDALKLNNEFLFRHGATYFDPTMRLQGEIAFDESEKEDCIRRIREFLAGCPRARVLLIKEPRITALLEFWLEAARRDEFSVKAVIPIRHPREVAASHAAYGVSVELSNALWLKYNLLAERHSRDLPRVFVEYSNLLNDWRVEVARISQGLSIDLPLRDEAAVDAFLTPDLYRKRCSGPMGDMFGHSWTSRAYAILSAAAQDASIDLPALDEIYHAYGACERAFRVSLDDFRTNFAPHRFREAREHALAGEVGSE